MTGLPDDRLAELSELIPAWNLTQDRYGRDDNPVLIIDNFMPEPEAWVTQLETLNYARRSPYNPGVQAPLPGSYLGTVSRGLEFIFQHGFDFRRQMQLENLLASYVTCPPTDLAPIQRYPHYDGGHNGMVAVLHFLCGPEQGGTRFFRHDRTGFETVTRAQDDIYGAARNVDIDEYGLRDPAYFYETGHGFTLLHTVPAKFNRAIIYSSTTIHSGDLGANPSFDVSPNTGRLTVNTFVSPA